MHYDLVGGTERCRRLDQVKSLNRGVQHSTSLKFQRNGRLSIRRWVITERSDL